MASTNGTIAMDKPRRIQRACDVCRRRKIKCETNKKLGKACAHCQANQFACTYDGTPTRATQSTTYAKRLETRLERMEELLEQLCTDESDRRELQDALGKEYQASSGTRSSPNIASPSTTSSTRALKSPMDDIAMLIRNKITESPTAMMNSVAANIRRLGQAPNRSGSDHRLPLDEGTYPYHESPHEDSDSDSGGDLEMDRVVTQSLRRIHVQPPEYRFFGKSSGSTLVKMAMEAKELARSGTTSSANPSPAHLARQIANLRPEFWAPRPWESAILPRPRSPVLLEEPSAFCSKPTPTSSDLHLPPPDLALVLIENYFTHLNLYFPLLHRPTFDQMVLQHGFLCSSHSNETRPRKEGFVETEGFAQVYLLVCALGSWYSDDPRCFLHGQDASSSDEESEPPNRPIPGSAGWKWFNQVQLMNNRTLFTPPTLEHLQTYALSAQFLEATSAPQSCWTVAGIGIRFAQEIGIHRRNSILTQVPTRDGELWKRAFWVLVCIDRLMSYHLGRSTAIQDEDFDLDPPVDCDDEFWDTENPDPTMRFRQPPNKPSLVTHFLRFIDLSYILLFALKSIYPIRKSVISCGWVGPELEHALISELDSALNKWAASVPDFLKWDPDRQTDEKLFNQSASLWASYYLIQMLVHRPFIPSKKRPAVSAIPSLAICTNAARACCHLVDVQQARTGAVIAHIQTSAFQSGVLLLFNVWGGKRTGAPVDLDRELADVHMCLKNLKLAEHRWHSVGKIWDLLSGLISAGDMVVPMPPLDAHARCKQVNVSAKSVGTLGEDYILAKPLFPESESEDAPSDLVVHPDYALIRAEGYSDPSLSSSGSEHLPTPDDHLNVPPVTHLTHPFEIPFATTDNAVDPSSSGFAVFDGKQTASAETSGSPGAFDSTMFSTQLAGYPASLYGAYPFTTGMSPNPTDGTGFSDASSLPTSYQNLDATLSTNELMSLWMDAPPGYQIEQWDAYLSNISMLTQQDGSGGF